MRISSMKIWGSCTTSATVVARTDVPDLSRMTIVIQGHDAQIIQAQKQLEDMVPVWACLDYSAPGSRILERELLLVKVSTVPPDLLTERSEGEGDPLAFQALHATALSPMLASSLQRQAIRELASLFHARVVDVTTDAMVLEYCAKSGRVDALVRVLEPYGILECARSGVMAMARSPVEGLYSSASSAARAAASSLLEEDAADMRVDATMLPPG
jgi:acetolactate synthase I/III small subunit